MDEERKFMWSWYNTGTGKESGAVSMTMIAMKEFEEIGQYTSEECGLLNQIKDELQCPEWVPWGHDTNYVELNSKSAEKFNRQIMERFRKLTS